MDSGRRGCGIPRDIGGGSDGGNVQVMNSKSLRQYRFFRTTGRLVVGVVCGLFFLLAIAPDSGLCGSHDSAQVAWSYDTGG